MNNRKICKTKFTILTHYQQNDVHATVQNKIKIMDLYDGPPVG